MYNSGNSSKNVTGASIVDGTVETVDIADDAVTADKLANTVNTDIATGVSGSATADAALPLAGGTMTGNIIGSKTAYVIPSAGSKTFTFTPSGTFTIPGPNDRGSYFIEIDFMGYFTGSDQTVTKRFHIYASTLGASIYDAGTVEVHQYGDSRRTDLTGAAPINAGSSAFSIVFSNANATNSLDGYFTWRTLMTTSAISLAVT
jgi:hypothetical protein